MADVPSWKVTHRHFNSETGEMFLLNLKHLESYLRIENPECLALNMSMSISPTLLMNGLRCTREAESLNAYRLCFSSCAQKCCLLYLYRAPENSKNKLLFERKENPDHKSVVFYIIKNNPVSEPNTNTCMLGGSTPESTAFISS